MPRQNIVEKPPASFSNFFKATLRLIERPLHTNPGRKDRLTLIPPSTPKQLAEKAENTPEFQDVVNDLVRLKDAHRYQTSWLLSSASELLRRSGYYHGVLADHSEREIWERLSPYARSRKAQIKNLLLLDGCVFPRKEFEIANCTIVRHSAAEIGELGPPPKIAESFFPEETLDRDWYSQQWFLRSSGKSVDLEPGSIRSLLEFIDGYNFPLNTYWPQLLALGLYDISCFDIPIILRSEAKWDLHRLCFSAPRVDPAGGGYAGYDEDGEPIPIPGPFANYKVADHEWSQFEALLRFCEAAIDYTQNWRSIRITARRYLRATFLSVRFDGDNLEDILLQYIIGLESLLLAGDRDAITDKIATRAALIGGTGDDERKEIFDLVRRAYSSRSDVVHGKEGKKKDIDFTRLRDICRRVIVVVLSVARECENDNALARVIKDLQISQALQDTVAKHRGDVFPLIK